MASSSVKAYQALAAAWPKDPLRPTVSFAKALEARAAKGLSSDECIVERETAVLRRLLGNEYQKQFPLSPNFTAPRSNPSYYADLLAEIEQAPTRSWWSRQMQSWKSYFRFS